jgi:hypothetical protein
MDVVAVYSLGYYDQHEEVESLDRLLSLLVVNAPVNNPEDYPSPVSRRASGRLGRGLGSGGGNGSDAT